MAVQEPETITHINLQNTGFQNKLFFNGIQGYNTIRELMLRLQLKKKSQHPPEFTHKELEAKKRVPLLRNSKRGKKKVSISQAGETSQNKVSLVTCSWATQAGRISSDPVLSVHIQRRHKPFSSLSPLLVATLYFLWLLLTLKYCNIFIPTLYH